MSLLFKRQFLLLLVLVTSAGSLFVLPTANAFSHFPANQIQVEDRHFPKGRFVRKQIRFWEKVFSKWPSTTVVVHESGDPDNIIDIIDYRSFAKRDQANIASRKERNKVTKRYLARYNLALTRFEKLQKGALKYGAIETRVYQVYRKSPQDLQRLYKGQVQLRTQPGLSDDFESAAKQAVVYLPEMEKVFHSYGLPISLTRIPFVESMFNIKAYSKVGAAGPWQFMPATAREFMYVNSLVDERKSIFKATKAAAQLLAINYRELKSWPHAITAYNHGRGGMKKAIRLYGRRNYDHTILKYESKSYGFASKNFYAEFIAAKNVFEKMRKRIEIHPDAILEPTETIILKKPTSVAQILRHSPINLTTLKELNPGILHSTFTKHQHKPLPKYFALTVPQNKARATQLVLNRIKGKSYARR